jgi:hypothetical protein
VASSGNTARDSVDLDMRVRLVDGDEVIADSSIEGSFVGMCSKFERYIQKRFRK